MDVTEFSLRHLLVALDGSHLAEAVLPLVRVLAKALGAKVSLLHVLEQHPPATVHGEPHLTSKADAEIYLGKIADQLRTFSIVTETHVHSDPQRDVALSIASHATELNADVIILAAHGQGGIRELVVGRIPQQVAAHAGQPVLIVPTPTSKQFSSIRRILLPIDLIGEALAAVPTAQLLASACKAEIILETIVPTPETVRGEAGAAAVFLPQTTIEILKIAEDQARLRLEQLADTLIAAGIPVKVNIRRGDPARELLDAIRKHDIDLVVMATHGRIGFDGLWAGSVAPRVTTASPCPVLLIPIRQKLNNSYC